MTQIKSDPSRISAFMPCIIRTWRGVHYGSYEEFVKTLLGLDEQVVLSRGRPRNADVSAVDRQYNLLFVSGKQNTHLPKSPS